MIAQINALSISFHGFTMVLLRSVSASRLTDFYLTLSKALASYNILDFKLGPTLPRYQTQHTRTSQPFIQSAFMPVTF